MEPYEQPSDEELEKMRVKADKPAEPGSYVKAHMREALKGHKLSVVSLSATRVGVSVFNMKRDGTRIMKVQISFTPEGIFIMGDLCPGLHGVGSALGYGLGWFKGRKSEGYLCEKFLVTGFVAEYAADSIEDTLKDPEDYDLTPDAVKGLREVITHLRDDSSYGETRLYDDLCLLDYPTDDGVPGYGYDPRDAGWLCAIQQRFAELWDDSLIPEGEP
jgi:hypothetical protein